jgi:PRTRC genetic system protein A
MNLANYLPAACAVLTATRDLAPMSMQSPNLIEYLVGANGLYARAVRREISACLALWPGRLGGEYLVAVEPHFRLNGPRVPAAIVSEMLDLARLAAPEEQGADELLFYLTLGEAGWALHVPPQEATTVSVRATLDAHNPAYSQAVLEVHSHHRMHAFFSADDNREEAGKFRLFAVLGDIDTRPTLVVRLGMWGYFWNLAPQSVFEMPGEVQDGWATDEA